MTKKPTIRELTEKNLTRFLVSKGPKLLDVYSPHCQPCRDIAPILDKLAEEYHGRVKFAKVNIEESETARDMLVHFEILGVPAVMIQGNGKGGFLMGSQTEEIYRQAIEMVLEVEA